MMMITTIKLIFLTLLLIGTCTNVALAYGEHKYESSEHEVQGKHSQAQSTSNDEHQNGHVFLMFEKG